MLSLVVAGSLDYERAMRYLLPLLLLATPCMAQDRLQRSAMPTDDTPTTTPVVPVRQSVTPTAEPAGQRQTRDMVARETGIEPLARIGNRIENRVQSRIRNRIDRYYSPTANAASPFAVASERARNTRDPRR